MVLFAWMQFLKEETLGYLNVTSPYEPKICEQGQKQNRAHKEEACGAVASAAAAQEEALDPRAIQDVESQSSLMREILDFDQAQREKRFNSQMYLCDICFSEKLGSECMHFVDCSHVYCKACLKDYFEIQIRDGQVHCLNCPGSECSSVATPAQVTLCDLIPAGTLNRRVTGEIWEQICMDCVIMSFIWHYPETQKQGKVCQRGKASLSPLPENGGYKAWAVFYGKDFRIRPSS